MTSISSITKRIIRKLDLVLLLANLIIGNNCLSKLLFNFRRVLQTSGIVNYSNTAQGRIRIECIKHSWLEPPSCRFINSPDVLDHSPPFL